MPSKIIDKGWILKRKRRNHSQGPDTSAAKEDPSAAESSDFQSSAKRRQKTQTLDQSLSKKKGNDGVSALMFLGYAVVNVVIVSCF